MKKRGIFLILVFLIIGCGPAQIIGQWTTKTFALKDSITLPPEKVIDLDTAEKTGRDLGYQVMGLDKDAGVITFSCSSASGISSFLIRKTDYTTLVVSVADRGKKVVMEMQTIGNFGRGGEEETKRAMTLFKNKLLEKI